MSSIITKKKTVVLFTPGLGMDDTFFEPTIDNLTKKSAKVVAYPEEIDMVNFQVSKNRFVTVDKGYLVNNQDELDSFTEHISAICTLADKNPKKAILVRVDLERFPSFRSGEITPLHWDSVSNQSIKLAFIVKAIKTEDSDINVILVGHSQGGLVNLETATRIPEKIKRLVSISTPYREVFAADLLTLVLAADRYVSEKYNNGSLVAFAAQFMSDIADVNCQNRVFDLSSETFFATLHSKWNECTNRPPLTVITGTSGHLVTLDLGVIRTKQSFDGLVRTSEQKGISHAKFVNLANISTPCLAQKTIFNETCYDSHLSPCKYLCPLPNFSLGGMLEKATFMAFLDSVKTGNMDNFLNHWGEEAVNIFNAIFDGDGRKDVSLNPLYKSYYDIYASDYSHRYLPRCEETIGTLLAEFES